ncbi:MAG: hypothetical protein KA236_16765, partial [Verrucomicrobia bacterium]|nr:hypothetical protein [Verrucomicrobiota bacterium]
GERGTVPTLGKNQPFECFKANPFSALPLKSALPRSDEIFGLARGIIVLSGQYQNQTSLLYQEPTADDLSPATRSGRI